MQKWVVFVGGVRTGDLIGDFQLAGVLEASVYDVGVIKQLAIGVKEGFVGAEGGVV
jgi:hypothetical protein